MPRSSKPRRMTTNRAESRHSAWQRSAPSNVRTNASKQRASNQLKSPCMCGSSDSTRSRTRRLRQPMCPKPRQYVEASMDFFSRKRTKEPPHNSCPTVVSRSFFRRSANCRNRSFDSSIGYMARLRGGTRLRKQRQRGNRKPDEHF